MKRLLTDRERNLLVSTLKLMETNEHGAYMITEGPENPYPYLGQVDDLEVVGKCSCGDTYCETVEFVPTKGTPLWQGYPIASGETDEGQLIIVFAKDGKLTELEIVK